MVLWNVYRLERIYKVDRNGKSKLDGHQEVFIGTLRADDKTEAQLITGAVHGSHAFVCSDVSDRQQRALRLGRAS